MTGEGTFSATTVGGTEDPFGLTQLFLFDANCIGIYGNDNDPECNCNQSTLLAGNALTPTAPGIYYLGITGRFVDPVSIQGEIFSDGDRPLLSYVSSTAAITLISPRVENASNPHYCVQESPNSVCVVRAALLRTPKDELTLSCLAAAANFYTLADSICSCQGSR